jgi:hypothetical protein
MGPRVREDDTVLSTAGVGQIIARFSFNTRVLTPDAAWNRMRPKTHFASPFNLIIPSSPFAKNIPVSFFQKSCITLAVLPHRRGAYASSRTSRQDVVAALMSGALCARRLASARTAKPCGPDTPTLVSALMRKHHALRWPKSPAHRGEHGATVNPSRGEGRANSAEPVVPAPCTFVRTGAAGASRRPVFPAPSRSRVTSWQSSGANGAARRRSRVPVSRGRIRY